MDLYLFRAIIFSLSLKIWALNRSGCLSKWFRISSYQSLLVLREISNEDPLYLLHACKTNVRIREARALFFVPRVIYGLGLLSHYSDTKLLSILIDTKDNKYIVFLHNERCICADNQMNKELCTYTFLNFPI